MQEGQTCNQRGARTRKSSAIYTIQQYYYNLHPYFLHWETLSISQHLNFARNHFENSGPPFSPPFIRCKGRGTYHRLGTQIHHIRRHLQTTSSFYYDFYTICLPKSYETNDNQKYTLYVNIQSHQTIISLMDINHCLSWMCPFRSSRAN